MAYPTDTTLRRNDPKEDAFDHISVVGNSPIRTSRAGEWVGETGEDVIVQPVEDFAGPQTFPESVLTRDYEVEFMPESSNEIENTPRDRRPKPFTVAPEEALRRKQADLKKAEAEKKAARAASKA